MSLHSAVALDPDVSPRLCSWLDEYVISGTLVYDAEVRTPGMSISPSHNPSLQTDGNHTWGVAFTGKQMAVCEGFANNIRRAQITACMALVFIGLFPGKVVEKGRIYL